MIPYHLAFRCLYAATVLYMLRLCFYAAAGALYAAAGALYAAADPSDTQCNIAQILISLTLLSYSIK